MNLSGKDRQKIIWNAIARAGGIDKIDVASELAKSVAMLNGFQSQDMISQAQAGSQPVGAPISSQTPQSMPEGQNGLGGSNLP